MTITLPFGVEESVHFKESASASVIVEFAGKSRRRAASRIQKVGYPRSPQFDNVTFIVARSSASEDAQAWFWTPGWQQGEAQATAEAAAGLGRVYDNAEDFLASLDD